MFNAIDLSEYADPVLYDSENTAFEPDGPFYLEVARQVGGPVLELGCGTGRLTIPLAQAGLEITGLDVTPGMLARARQQAGELPIQWVEADARAFHLGRRFGVVLATGGLFQHLLGREDQEALLARVREHLAPEGRFVFSTFFPSPEMLENVPEEKPWFTYTDLRGREVRVSGTELYDPIRQVKTETAYRRWFDEVGKEVVQVAPLALRYVFPQEVEALLHYNGFAIEAWYGDWDRTPLTGESQTMIVVCRVR